MSEYYNNQKDNIFQPNNRPKYLHKGIQKSPNYFRSADYGAERAAQIGKDYDQKHMSHFVPPKASKSIDIIRDVFKIPDTGFSDIGFHETGKPA